MTRTIQRSTALAAALTLVVASLALSAPRAEAANKYFTVFGRVLKINEKERTLLVDDRSAKKLYLVRMPENATLKIWFGINRQLDRPGFEHVFKNDRVRIQCIRPDREHYAKLDDGRQVIAVTASGQ